MNNGDRHMNGDGGRLPTGTSDNGGYGETSRRDFLKVLGVAGAGAAATSCGPPDMSDKLIPYLLAEFLQRALIDVAIYRHHHDLFLPHGS